MSTVTISLEEYEDLKAENTRQKKDLLKYTEIIHQLTKQLEELRGINRGTER